MNKRNIVVLTLIVALVLSISVGCGPKAPEEMLREAAINSANINTSQQELEVKMNLTLENADPMVAMFAQMLNNASLKMNMKSNKEAMTSTGDVTIDLNGMAYTGEIFTTSETFAFKTPTIEPYIVAENQHMDTEVEEVDEETTKAMEEIMETVLKRVANDQIEELGKKNVTTPEGDVETTALAIKLTDEEIKEMIKELVPMVYENPLIREQMASSIKSQSEMQGMEITDEEIQEQLDQQKEDFKKNFAEMDEAMKFEAMDMTFYIDGESNIRKTDFNMAISVKDEETGQNVKLGLEGSTKIWNINEELNIEIPEFNETNSIGIEALMNQFMGGIPQ